MLWVLLAPATKLRQGNDFTPVCQSFCSWGRGVSVPACTTGHMTKGSLSRGVCVQGVCVQGNLCPGGSLSIRSLSRGPLSRVGVYVQGESLSRGSLSRGGLCHGDPLYGNEQAVLIRLECILVCNEFGYEKYPLTTSMFFLFIVIEISIAENIY